MKRSSDVIHRRNGHFATVWKMLGLAAAAGSGMWRPLSAVEARDQARLARELLEGRGEGEADAIPAGSGGCLCAGCC
jgi:hypothetical protein